MTDVAVALKDLRPDHLNAFAEQAVEYGVEGVEGGFGPEKVFSEDGLGPTHGVTGVGGLEGDEPAELRFAENAPCAVGGGFHADELLVDELGLRLGRMIVQDAAAVGLDPIPNLGPGVVGEGVAHVGAWRLLRASPIGLAIVHGHGLLDCSPGDGGGLRGGPSRSVPVRKVYLWRRPAKSIIIGALCALLHYEPSLRRRRNMRAWRRR